MELQKFMLSKNGDEKGSEAERYKAERSRLV